jgi:hypothetical protein
MKSFILHQTFYWQFDVLSALAVIAMKGFITMCIQNEKNLHKKSDDDEMLHKWKKNERGNMKHGIIFKPHSTTSMLSRKYL